MHQVAWTSAGRLIEQYAEPVHAHTRRHQKRYCSRPATCQLLPARRGAVGSLTQRLQEQGRQLLILPGPVLPPGPLPVSLTQRRFPTFPDQACPVITPGSTGPGPARIRDPPSPSAALPGRLSDRCQVEDLAGCRTGAAASSASSWTRAPGGRPGVAEILGLASGTRGVSSTMTRYPRRAAQFADQPLFPMQLDHRSAVGPVRRTGRRGGHDRGWPRTVPSCSRLPFQARTAARGGNKAQAWEKWRIQPGKLIRKRAAGRPGRPRPTWPRPPDLDPRSSRASQLVAGRGRLGMGPRPTPLRRIESARGSRSSASRSHLLARKSSPPGCGGLCRPGMLSEDDAERISRASR